MSDTPRTDAEFTNYYRFNAYVPKESAIAFAKKLERELAEAKRNYRDLIMSVGKAYPNETRHQTALRYIRERETPSTDQAKCSAIRKGE